MVITVDNCCVFFGDLKSVLGIEYSSRNATKCREHLAFKCPKIDEDTQEQMKSTFSQEYINSFNTNKRSSIWEHYNIIVDDGIVPSIE